MKQTDAESHQLLACTLAANRATAALVEGHVSRHGHATLFEQFWEPAVMVRRWGESLAEEGEEEAS